jgi:hypothetical protein
VRVGISIARNDVEMSSAYGYENFLFQKQNLLYTLCNCKFLNRTPPHDVRTTSVVQHCVGHQAYHTFLSADP